MAKNRDSKPRKMRSQFLVLCEGETEENYVNLLRQNYRLPIKIISRIVGDKITQNLILRHQRNLAGPISPTNIFAMYDGDMPEVVNNLKNCECVILLSKPCIEIWFISHFKKPLQSPMSNNECISQLKELPNWRNYKKAHLSETQESLLWENRMTAVSNMKDTPEESKVHSSVFKLINRLEKEKTNNQFL